MGKTGMEILKFENAPAPRQATTKKKSNLKSLAGLATVAAVAVLGSTLAANISLGSGSSIEFGQGVQVTSACDSAITLAPKVIFSNTSGGGVFNFSTVSFSNVDSVACNGKTFQLNAYGDTLATPLALSSSAGAAVSTATVGMSSTSLTQAAGFTISGTTGLGTATSAFDLGFSTPQSTSGAVYKLTLQSN
jgi:hypothetical protein